MPPIGTTKLPELDAALSRHGAKLKTSEVHALYLGALTSTNPRLGPQHLLEWIFGDEPDLGLVSDQAMEVFGVVLGYWNHLLDERGKGRVQLAPLSLRIGATVDELCAYTTRRHEELTWYIRGINAGGGDPCEFEPQGQEIFKKISEAGAFLGAFAELLQREAPEITAQRDWRDTLLKLIATVEHMIADLMTVSDAVRRAALATFRSHQGRATNDGVQIARAPRVPRNAPCPCGSGKKWKKCCGSPLQAQ